MKLIPSGGLALVTALALAGSPCHAEAPLQPARSVAAQHIGVSIAVEQSGFTLVTLGVWHTPALADRSAVRFVPIDFRRARVRGLSTGSFRRAIYLAHVQAAERQYALPEGLLDALIWTESRYNPVAISKAGAVGLGQLMPGTAQALGVDNRYDPRANLLGAAQYLRQLLDQFGAINLAVSAYNAGPRAVLISGGIPNNSETPNYVRNILDYWKNQYYQKGNYRESLFNASVAASLVR